MTGEHGAVLPYRTTADDLARFVEAKARGRDLAQIQALNFSAASFQGTLVGATALGFLDAESRDLLPRGREFVLADPEQRRGLLLQAMREFEPYGLLLEAIFERRDHAETTLDWIITWWGSNNYGNSQTNRDEGSAAFARLAEYAGLGTFVPGRRGHPTRLRWSDRAEQAVRGQASSPREAQPRRQREPREVPQSATPEPPVEAQIAIPEPSTAPEPRPRLSADTQPTFDGRSSLVLTLGPGRTVDLSVPAQVTAAEKHRLLSLINLFISTPGD